MRTLADMRVGERARIESIDGTDSLAQRLMEMGVLVGDSIEVLGFAPLGDPMLLRLKHYRLSLRIREAARIAVGPPLP